MKSKIIRIRNIGVIVCSIAIMIMLISSFFMGADKKDNYGLDEDTFSIENLTEEQKLKVSGFGTSYVTRWSDRGNSSGFVGNVYLDEDHDYTYFRAKKTTGIKTVNATEAESCSVNWKINCTVSSGKAKIIIVMDESVILEEFEPNQPIDFTYESVGKHEFLVKTLCEDAKIEIEVNRTITKD